MTQKQFDLDQGDGLQEGLKKHVPADGNAFDEDKMKPIPDKAEIVLEYPDKFYSGTFGHSSHFDAHFDERGIALAFSREGGDGERKSVHMHVHYALFAEILNELAKTASAIPPTDARHQEALAGAAATLAAALQSGQRASAAGDEDTRDMTADEEVNLLHILE